MLRKIMAKLRQRTVEPQRQYTIDGFHLDMGEGHMLSVYQKQFPMYDRFVPFLGKVADAKADAEGVAQPVILDVGANVGDTVAGFIRHTRARTVCVEPTEKFISLLRKNVGNMPAEYQKRIDIVQAYVGQNAGEHYVSSVSGGTAHKELVSDIGEAPTLTVTDVLARQEIPASGCVLIKTDTDGYDSECLLSAGGGTRARIPHTLLGKSARWRRTGGEIPHNDGLLVGTWVSALLRFR